MCAGHSDGNDGFASTTKAPVLTIHRPEWALGLGPSKRWIQEGRWPLGHVPGRLDSPLHPSDRGAQQRPAEREDEQRGQATCLSARGPSCSFNEDSSEQATKLQPLEHRAYEA